MSTTLVDMAVTYVKEITYVLMSLQLLSACTLMSLKLLTHWEDQGGMSAVYWTIANILYQQSTGPLSTRFSLHFCATQQQLKNVATAKYCTHLQYM